MRFIFGLMLGALLTLFLASLVEPPLAKATESAALVPPTAPHAAMPVSPDPEADSPSLAKEVVQESAQEVALEAAPEPTLDIEPPVTVPPSPVALRPNLPAGIPTGSAAAVPVGVSRDTPAEREPHSAAEAGTVSVWQPFHSEASAQGFARRLSTQLGYPFAVSRVAAAEYHVVFAYANEAERGLLESQLSALTGRAFR